MSGIRHSSQGSQLPLRTNLGLIAYLQAHNLRPTKPQREPVLGGDSWSLRPQQVEESQREFNSGRPE